jgi:GH15 family glucan-1,4-alpha-glucosidase
MTATLNKTQIASGANLDLGVVGNCTIAALIDQTASIVWFCFPRLDADPVFCSLIGGDKLDDASMSGTGRFSIELDRGMPFAQRYVPNTPILETLIEGPAGAIKITDFAPRFQQFDRIFRPAMFVRIVEPVSGHPRINVRLKPRCNLGQDAARQSQGSHHIRFNLGDQSARVTTDASVDLISSEIPFLLNKPVVFIFGNDEPLTRAPIEVAREFLGATMSYWLAWARSLSIPFEWQDVVIRSAITLKLCEPCPKGWRPCPPASSSRN